MCLEGESIEIFITTVGVSLMVYEFLILHTLKNNESATTPEQITKLLKADGYWFVDGNGVRVTLKRLKDKGLSCAKRKWLILHYFRWCAIL
jgi:hypothetical protein